MKEFDCNDKFFTKGASGASEDAMTMSNQIADLMREKLAGNTGANLSVLGFPKDDFFNKDSGVKEAFSGVKEAFTNPKQVEESALILKKKAIATEKF